MGVKGKIKKLAEQLTGTRIVRELPRGVDFAEDIAKWLPTYNVNTIFDVGANVGQSATLFLSKFPSSQIFCFEPVSDTFHQLQQRTQDDKRVNCYQLAFGSTEEEGKMVLEGSSDMFFLLDSTTESANNGARMESVNVDTIDSYCQKNSVEDISYLKIDTEGGDLDVLRGARTMLVEQRIDIIQVEAGMSPTTDRHVSFESIKSFLESQNYYLFGIYEQVNEWPTKEPHLRRINPIFLSKKVVKQNQITS
jgi:FkbM family methyltransferase